MNFMSCRPAGFYEDTGTGMPSSSTSSPSSSSSLLQLPVYAYGPRQMPDSSPTSAGEDDSDDHVFAGSSTTTSGMAAPIEKEHMFDKVVTPSDVGKLNRLVIPKQYAEKYFPLDSSANEKGLLLNFEDRTGKPWRFRYSYWNSSQSYVMTKGWSRFVKDKKLDAGDVVSFQRGVGESGRNRLFIDWRRRPHMEELPPLHISTLSVPHQFSFHRTAVHPWNPRFLQQPNGAVSAHHQYLQHHYPYASFYNGNPYPSSPAPIGYPRSVFSGTQQHGGELRQTHGSGGVGVEHMVFDSVPVVQGKAAAKRLRLFGVNMDCPTPADESDENSSIPVVQHSLSPTQFESPPHHPDPEHRSYNHSDDKGKGSMSLDLDI